MTESTSQTRSDVLADYIGRHRMFIIALELRHDAQGIAPVTMEAVREFTRSKTLELLHVNEKEGIAYIRASKKTLEEAFGISMVVVNVDGVRYRMISGTVTLPPELERNVMRVTGFDTRPAVSSTPEAGLQF